MKGIITSQAQFRRMFRKAFRAPAKGRGRPCELELRFREKGGSWQLAWAAQAPSAKKLAEQVVIWIMGQGQEFTSQIMRAVRKSGAAVFEDLGSKLQKELEPHVRKVMESIQERIAASYEAKRWNLKARRGGKA